MRSVPGLAVQLHDSLRESFYKLLLVSDLGALHDQNQGLELSKR